MKSNCKGTEVIDYEVTYIQYLGILNLIAELHIDITVRTSNLAKILI